MATILNGAVAPTTEGADGDFYIDTVLHKIHGPKATTWPAGVSLVGPTGAAGADGTVIRNSAGAPVNGTGVDGDYWINTVNSQLYKRVSGSYVSQFSLTALPATITNLFGAPDSNGPNNWVDIVIDGSNVTAKNRITGDTFSGTIANFNILLAPG